MRKKLITGLSVIVVASCLTLGVNASTKILDLSKATYKEDVQKAVDSGLMELDSKGNFNPKQSLTREEMAKYLNQVNENKHSNNTEEIDIGEIGMNSTAVVRQGNNKGAGVFISKTQILTAHHVVANGESINVSIKDSKKNYSAKVIKVDKWNDLALIQLNETPSEEFNYKRLTLSLDGYKTGDEAFAFGHPRNLTYSMTSGSISNSNQLIGGTSKIQFDGQVHPGYSGGPLFNKEGKLIGIVTNLLKGSNSSETYYGISFATPSSIIKTFLTE